MSEPMSFNDELEKKWAEADKRMEDARLRKEKEKEAEAERKSASERREALQKADFQKKMEEERQERIRQRKLLISMPGYVREAPEDINEPKKKSSILDRFRKSKTDEKPAKKIKTQDELMKRVVRIRDEAKSDDGLVLGVTRFKGHEDTGIGAMMTATLSEDCQKDKNINTPVFAEIADVTKKTGPYSVVNSLSGHEQSFIPSIDAIEQASMVEAKVYGRETFFESIVVYNEDGSENQINGIPPTLRVSSKDKSVRAIPPELSINFVKVFSRRSPLVIGTNEEPPAYKDSTMLPVVVQNGLADGVVIEITVSEVEEDFPNQLAAIIDKYDQGELFFLLYMPAGEDFLRPIATRTARDIIDAGIPRNRVSYITHKCHPEKRTEDHSNRHLARTIVDSLLNKRISEEEEDIL